MTRLRPVKTLLREEFPSHEAEMRYTMSKSIRTSQRKFSTSINSLPDWSNCVYKSQRPSGETETPPSAELESGFSKLETGRILFVAKLRNWREEAVPPAGTKNTPLSTMARLM